MKKILFATNLSAADTTALAWAKLFARQYTATLVLMHVQPMPMPDTTLATTGTLGLGMLNPMTSMIPAELMSIDQEQLDKLAAELRADKFTCQTELRRGDVTDAIVTTADAVHADLIIVGRSHLDTFFERLAGTRATGVAQQAHCPVLVVPTGESQPAHLGSVLFSTSLEFDQPEFGPVVELTRAFGASLSVVHVHAENQPAMSDIDRMVAQLQQHYGDTPLRVETIDARTVTGGLETYLETHHPDLLVMTSRERGFLSGLLNPSLTGRMVSLTHAPILVYHNEGDL